jgi:hypothetical protein
MATAVDVDDSDICDCRLEHEFGDITFSKFKKKDAIKELMECIQESKVEPACFWSAELVCAGHFAELWETLIVFYASHIHIGNPKIARYLELKANQFKDILTTAGTAKLNIHFMRNNSSIRRMFGEIVFVLCVSKRKNEFNAIKMKESDFNMDVLHDKFKAYAEKSPQLEAVFKHDAMDANIKDATDANVDDFDPIELFPALNELAHCMSNKNSIQACYWMEWMFAYEQQRQKKGMLLCARRVFCTVPESHQRNLVWLIWELIRVETDSRNSRYLSQIVESLLFLFCMRFTKTTIKKRKSILYFVIALLSETSISTDEIVPKSNLESMAQIRQNIDFIYLQVKANEIRTNRSESNTFKEMKEANLACTLQKLETMKKINETFVPRIG